MWLYISYVAGGGRAMQTGRAAGTGSDLIPKKNTDREIRQRAWKNGERVRPDLFFPSANGARKKHEHWLSQAWRAFSRAGGVTNATHWWRQLGVRHVLPLVKCGGGVTAAWKSGIELRQENGRLAGSVAVPV